MIGEPSFRNDRGNIRLYVSEAECVIDIVRWLKNKLLQYEIPKKFVRVKTIPRNSRGKVDRTKVFNILSNDDTKG